MAKTFDPEKDLTVLTHRIGSVRRRYALVRSSQGLLFAIALVAGVLGLEMLLDWLFHFRWPVRLVFFLAAWSAAGYFIWNEALKHLRRRPTDDAVALMIERAMPIFRSRYIASVQLSRLTSKNASRALVGALVAETAAAARTLNFKWVIKTERLKKAAKAAAIVLAAVAGLGMVAGNAAPALLARAFLLNVPVPKKTQIESITGAATIGIGDDFRIEARVRGVVPASGRLSVRSAEGVVQEYPLERSEEEERHFSQMLSSVQEPFSYSVRIGDAEAGPFEVKTMLRLTVKEVSATQYFPPYIDQEPVERSTGNLSLLAGSRLEVRMTASGALQNAVIALEPEGGLIPMSVDAQEPADATGEISIPVEGLEGFRLQMTDTHGIEAKGAATYRINILPDRIPEVSLTYPYRREELATAAAKMLLAFEASDDFGVRDVILHFTTDPENPEAGRRIDLDLGATPRQNVTRRFEWQLGKLDPPLVQGDIIEYWIEVRDANTVTGPGAGESERHQIRIVSAAEKRADLANRLNDTMSGLDEVAENQQEINRRLGKAIFEKDE